MRLSVLAAFTAALVTSVAAHASTISYEIYNGTTLIGSGSSTSGSLINGTGTDGNFFVSLNAVGPASNAPNFSTNNFSIAVNSLSTATTLSILVTNTGLLSSITPVSNTFSVNALASNGDFAGATISNYFDTTNTAYGMGSLLATASFTGVGGFAGPINSVVNATGLYSETTVYNLNFNASTSADSVSASSQIVAATPEPSSLALLGTGLLGVAAAARRRFLA